jgi:hypothetical protein
MTTICMTCRHLVHTAPGLCQLCGSVFTDTTIKRQVAAHEIESQGRKTMTTVLNRTMRYRTVIFTQIPWPEERAA